MHNIALTSMGAGLIKWPMNATDDQKTPEPSCFAVQDIFSQLQQFSTQWGATARAQIERWNEVSTQLHADGARRVEDATDEATRLIKSSLAHGRNLAEQWQTAGIDATRRALEKDQ